MLAMQKYILCTKEQEVRGQFNLSNLFVLILKISLSGTSSIGQILSSVCNYLMKLPLSDYHFKKVCPL